MQQAVELGGEGLEGGGLSGGARGDARGVAVHAEGAELKEARVEPRELGMQVLRHDGPARASVRAWLRFAQVGARADIATGGASVRGSGLR